MINLNKSAIEIFNKSLDVVEVIRLIYIFSLAKEKKLHLHFNQYYKNLNLENGIFQIKQVSKHASGGLRVRRAIGGRAKQFHEMAAQHENR